MLVPALGSCTACAHHVMMASTRMIYLSNTYVSGTLCVQQLIPTGLTVPDTAFSGQSVRSIALLAG
jgi:hypothetical protein